MKMSTKSRYAVRLMLDIAENEHNGNVSIKNMSARENISPKYLEQIASVLCKMGLLKSQRGAQGGYKLSRRANEYTVGNVLRAMEGEFSSDYITDSKASVNGFWDGFYDVINCYIDSVTINDLIERE